MEAASGDSKMDKKEETVVGDPKTDDENEAESGDPKMDKKKGAEAIHKEKLLVEAAATGDLPTVIALVESGVSVDAEEHNKTLFYASKNYMTPLQMACANGHAPCAEALITYGADVNAKDRFDVTAMHMAAEKGHCSSLKALLNANAECSLPTKYSKKGCYTAVPYLGGTTPLHLAATNNHTECVQELIQYGADYNSVDELGRTSLYIAAQFGFGECVLAHLKNAVGRDILSLPGLETYDTPLHFAVTKGMTDCVRALLRSGSDANHNNMSGNSPLHLAVNPTNENEAVSMEMLKSLVIDGYKTDINRPDYAELTPLHYVCFNGRNALRRRPEMAKFLISYGADPGIRSTRGFTLLECELKSASEDFEVLRYIVRSMLQPPRLSKMRVNSHLPQPGPSTRKDPVRPVAPSTPPNPQNSEMIGYVMAAVLRARANRGQDDPPMGSLHHKHLWYETVAANPRTLQHICRFTIRKALGPYNIKYIVKLPIPTAVQRYLFLEKGD